MGGDEDGERGFYIITTSVAILKEFFLFRILYVGGGGGK